MNWQPLACKTLSRAQVDLANQLVSAAAGTMQYTVGGQQYRVHLTAYSDDYHAAAALHCCLNGSRVLVYLNVPGMDALLGGIAPFSALQSLPEDLQLALLTAAMAPLAETLQEQWGVVLTLERFESLSGEVAGNGLLFSITPAHTAAAQNILVVIESALPTAFVERLCKVKPVASVRDYALLAVPVRFEVGAALLSLSEISLLRHGDIILLESSYLSDGHLRVNISDYFSCLAQIDGNSLIVQTQLEKIMAKEPKASENTGAEASDNVAATDTSAAAPESVYTLDTSDLPVNVLLVAGHFNLALKELQHVRPGYVFDLNKDASQVIEIRVNGTRIGSGEMVEVDGRAGVRVLECK